MSLDIKSSVKQPLSGKKRLSDLSLEEPFYVFISQLFLGFVLIYVTLPLGNLSYLFGCSYLIFSFYNYFQALPLQWFVLVELFCIICPTVLLQQVSAAGILSTSFILTLFADYLIELPEIKRESRVYKEEMKRLQKKHDSLIAQAQALETTITLQHRELDNARDREVTFEQQLKQVDTEKCMLQQKLVAYDEGAVLKQLREQFEEKKRELVQTRKSLFALEGELEETRKKFIDTQELFDQRLFQEMKEHLRSNEEELELLRVERDKLEAIVSHFHK